MSSTRVWKPLRAVTLLALISFVKVSSHGNSMSLCSKVDQLKQESKGSIEPNHIVATAEQHTQPILNCRDPSSLVQLSTEKVGLKMKATITACPNVHKVLMYVSAPGYFEGGTATNMRTISCFRPYSTLFLLRPIRRLKFVLTTSGANSEQQTQNLKLSWIYQYRTLNNLTKWSATKEYIECSIGQATNNLHCSNQPGLPREKRSNTQSSDSVPSERVCGKDQSCIRFGSINCSHLQCEYLLTYSTKNQTFLELEISGKSTGWIALGLSSDDKMGGDGVILCRRKSNVDTELEALTMWINLAHSRPKPKENMYTLTAHNYTNGYIYCKMTASLSQKKGADSDTTLDLTNNWYQFYAKGELDRTGLLLKHSQLPPISINTISMLRPVNIYSRQYRELHSASLSVHLHKEHSLPLIILALITNLFNRNLNRLILSCI